MQEREHHITQSAKQKIWNQAELIGQKIESLIPNELRVMHIQHRSGYIKSPKVRSMGAGLELNALKKGGPTVSGGEIFNIQTSPTRKKC